MHILLININPVVSRLVSLCAREEHIDLEEVHSVDAVVRDRYDVVFVDEASYDSEAKELLANLIIRKKVFLSSSDRMSDEASVFDSIITKPFLPSQITAVLESLEEVDTLEAVTEIPSIFPLSSDEESVEDADKRVDEILEEDKKADTKVLDSNEIEKIKALLDMDEEVEEVNETEYENRKREVITQQLRADGLEIVDEDEYVKTLSKKPFTEKKQKTKKQKNKPDKSKKAKKKNKEEVYTFEEALLAAIEGMKVKKIKKLLKDAEVTIKINFKDK